MHKNFKSYIKQKSDILEYEKAGGHLRITNSISIRQDMKSLFITISTKSNITDVCHRSCEFSSSEESIIEFGAHCINM